MQLMAGWLYIIKQAAGDMPGGTTPAKTHSLNTMFQEAITHMVPGEEHPDEGLQLLSPCLSCPAAFWFSYRRQECAGPGVPSSVIHPGTVSCTASDGFEAPDSITSGTNTSSSLEQGAEAFNLFWIKAPESSFLVSTSIPYSLFISGSQFQLPLTRVGLT